MEYFEAMRAQLQVVAATTLLRKKIFHCFDGTVVKIWLLGVIFLAAHFA